MILLLFWFPQLHACQAAGDLSSPTQDLHQEPGAVQNQLAAGPEGLLSEVRDAAASSKGRCRPAPVRQEDGGGARRGTKRVNGLTATEKLRPFALLEAGFDVG